MRKINEFSFGRHSGVLALVVFALTYIYTALLAVGSIVMAPIQAFAHAQVLTTGTFNIGVSPSSMNVGNLPQAQSIHYDKQFVKNLKANTPGVRCCARRELPEMSGNQHKLFMYQALNANTAQAAEGVIGSGLQVQVLNTSATIGQYADYVNFSDLSLQTAIDNALENTQRELAYRLGLSLSKLVLATADGASNIDSSVSANSKPANSPFGKTDITTNIQSLAGRNVMPFDRGRYCGMIHPFIVGDALNDTANNSMTDVLKRTAQGQEKLQELPAPDGDEVQVLDWAGCSFYATTIVTQTANYLASGKTAFRTYIMGEEALIAISLGKKEAAKIGDGDYRNLKLWTRRAEEPSAGDPARMIGGWTAYNVKFVVTLPPDTTMRLRYIDAVSNIA